MVDVRPPAPSELDPIERASRDEIAALQLQRLRATLTAPTSTCRTTGRCSRPTAFTRRT